MPTGRKDYYAILGVSRDATQEEIKQAYRRLVKEWHPDLHPENRKEAEERFKEIQEAYEVLSDPEKRRQYDLFGTVGTVPTAPTGYDPFSDLFRMVDEFFGFREPPRTYRRTTRSERGEDLEAVLTLTLEEAFKGGEKELEVEVWESCPECSGMGTIGGYRRCPECRGTGRIAYSRQMQGVFFRSVTTCPTCQGMGEIPSELCPECHGVGRIPIPPQGQNPSSARRGRWHGLSVVGARQCGQSGRFARRPLCHHPNCASPRLSPRWQPLAHGLDLDFPSTGIGRCRESADHRR